VLEHAVRSSRGAGTPAVSVVIPTRNESGNVALLVERLEQVLPDDELEVIFVDDSEDETPEAIRRISSSRQVSLIHREGEARVGGLGGAVVVGMRMARAPLVCVMDGDLQHPPEVLEEMVRKLKVSRCDLVVASRFCEGGSTGSFGRMRRAVSWVCTRSATALFRKRLRGVSDPMSGFFLVRRDTLDLDSLAPDGFKILLEIIVRTPDLRMSEVPFEFGERHSGKTKASAHEAVRYSAQLWRLFAALSARFWRFGVVGATGLAVNTLLLAMLVDVAGLYYLAAAILATQGSTLWNFAFTELWVFGGRNHRRRGAMRMGLFFAMNNVALALRVPILFALTTGIGLNYLVSNVISLVALAVLRFGVADVWIWASARSEEKLPHSYDIHGIVTVVSEVRLPELERFETGELVANPTLRVRIGRVSRSGPALNGHGPGLNGHGPGPELATGMNGHGPAANGHMNGAAAVNGNGVLPIRYREPLGGLGFAVEIRAGDPIEVTASPLLRWSPHVLYTNVVEPVLRWTFASKGYALIHAACFADGERGFLVTARTDTGKTTTALKTLDRFPYSFLSDDLTLLCPDGRVLAYPKPMTISRHTVQAVKTPRLSRAERAALVFQSRLHSRTGRRLAFVIAKLRVPAATLNAVTQFLVPPPKYHVERLVPRVKLAPEANLMCMFVIQRGGTGDDGLADEEALEILMRNCEDAFGFPPYPAIEPHLRSLNGHDLRETERAIVAQALASIPVTLMRSETMDWSERIPAHIERLANGNGSLAGQNALDREDEASGRARA
jgi:glycosyltransferase involved in cell wall biosynthesis